MSGSQNLITYSRVLRMFAERGHHVNVAETPIKFRNNTVLLYEQIDGEAINFKVRLYDNVVATLYPDDRVMVTTNGMKTNTTRNRLNDVLIPLGWKVKIISGNWYIVTREGMVKDFTDGMIVEPVLNFNNN